MESSKFAYASPSQGDEVIPITITVQRAQAESGLSMVTIYDRINDGSLETTVVGARRLIYYDSFLRMLGLNPDGSRSERRPYVPARYMGRMLSPEEQAARTKTPQLETPPKRRRGSRRKHPLPAEV
ncbi:hypothetical protein [Inquilinus sp. CA228]|uniref:hypothetical protein n=1 Tax=Inquilinus sp. CA228 TaxID=3455609 RepID=UPI003F8D26A6